MTAVKICGITRAEDALAAARAGAQALGFMFYPPSPRNVAPEASAAIIAGLPPFVSAVGVFVNPEAAWVEQVDEPNAARISARRPAADVLVVDGRMVDRASA